MAGTVAISVDLSQLPEGVQKYLLSITPNTSNLYAITTLTLANGANTINVPTWAAGAIIVPASTNAVAMTLKGVAGDTGIALSLTQPSELAFPASPPASFVLSSTGAGATTTSIIFF